MNREELEKALHDVWVKCEVNQDVFSDLTDFILDNFDPKQQTERVTAKECYLALLKNASVNLQILNRTVMESHEAADVFNNYNPESHE